MNIVFMGTPEFAVPSLVSLYEEGYDIDLVITQQDRRRGRGKKLQPTDVKKKALELGLSVYQPENVNSKESVEKIKSLKPDFIVVAAYGQIIRKDILAIPKYDIINVHASLLPKYRGAAPINWAIVNGEKETGITIMEIQEGLDTGDMILQESFKIKEDDDASKVHDRLAKLGGKLIKEAIVGIVDGSLNRKKQNDNESSYAPMLSKESGRIDWNKSSVEIRNLIRGFKPWPSAFTDYKGDMMKIHWAEISDLNLDGKPGEIVKVDKESIYVKTGDGVLRLVEIQMPGNRKMLTSQYLLGNNIEEKTILI